MHLHTIVRVRAANEEQAIERVSDLLIDDGEYNFPPPFDYVSEDETRISQDVKTEEDFMKLRALEREEHLEYMRLAAEADSANIKGYYIRKAGECLEGDVFWSTTRLQFTIDWCDGDKVFYVETDRHY